ncbi:MAG: fasciclin domain-containing protein [Chitinophagaceae bacterium]|jgi:uncharacterized surface protein with fasciclin (FAS1) repeats|nr:fasciclin domain-containing protein [Chitinophagaceae bacterium]
MKKILLPAMAFSAIVMLSCNDAQQGTAEAATPPSEMGGQSSVQDNESKPDVVKVAVNSPDHTTLVTALKAAEYVDALSNAGPFTVFAPVNEAFEALPAGTVEGLLKKENQNDLRTILEYHVYVGKLNPDLLQNGQTLGMASGHNVTITRTGDEIKVNDALVKGQVEASNGIIYIVDKVLLPPQN